MTSIVIIEKFLPLEGVHLQHLLSTTPGNKAVTSSEIKQNGKAIQIEVT